ncbi:cell wall-active antibiotics response protein LiaF [Domibacillus mangrovi]|uniref:Cell wall-active antibiotics response LiaF-like C-terminal domain-containing protein n=1 Tax=Domibacillus mangrovi TaxID=1714354 RepID=A0A1Q5P685_9BACI|nr:cell wall-active antibiotics response protein LiaF [Domibacillus mangrovi]OKL37703.1 hypothetical protein BLL40_03265 [Domibacillus mangrovi]
MFQRLTTNMFNWIMIFGVILFIIEIVFFDGGILFSALFFSVVTYAGWKKLSRLWGKCFFWGGLISLIIAILNMIAVRFLFVIGIILFLVHYVKTKKEADRIGPMFRIREVEAAAETMIQLKPLFDHKLFDDQKTENTAYQWRDVNIHGGFGDRVIDLSNTVLPEDTAVISIRHIIGNIEIYVPYEVEVSIHHSSIFGRAYLFGNHHENLMNQSLLYQTENYHSTYPRVKIITSLLSGDIEVKRI